MKAVNVTTDPTPVAAAGLRGMHFLYNASDVIIYLALDGDDEVSTATGIPLNPGERLFHEPPRGRHFLPAIYAVHGDSGNKSLRVGNSEKVIRAEE